ncbi:caspase-3-like [Amblyomma americanum]
MMDHNDRSEPEVSEEMHYGRLQTLVRKLIGTSEGISRLGLDLMEECWCHNDFKKSTSAPILPLDCKAPEKGDFLLQTMHCHFIKAPCSGCWRERSVCNLGIRVTPDEIWNQWVNLYKMRRWPRGKCIIIGNIAFKGYAEEREGCIEDVKRMRRLFLALHFDCIVATNLKADEMKALLKWAAKECDKEKDDCLVLVLMCHGKENYIYGTDYEPLHLYNDVYEQFSKDNCPELKGKPKLFFVQASRRGNYSCPTAGVPKNSDSGSMSADVCKASPASKTPECTATWSDMYIAHATIPCHLKLKNEESGSWFMSAIYEVFLEHAHTDSLANLMRSVHDVILSRASSNGSRHTPCTRQFGWSKDLYFYPGRMYSREIPKHRSSCSTLRYMQFTTRERILYRVVRRLPRKAKTRRLTDEVEVQSSSEDSSLSSLESYSESD